MIDEEEEDENEIITAQQRLAIAFWAVTNLDLADMPHNEDRRQAALNQLSGADAEVAKITQERDEWKAALTKRNDQFEQISAVAMQSERQLIAARQEIERLKAEQLGFPNLTAMREAMIATADENKEARQEIEALKTALEKRAYFANDAGCFECPDCKAWAEDGHTADCPYAQLLGDRE